MTNWNFSQNTNINTINCKCKLHVPLHTLKETSWTKYNAVQVQTQPAICNCKERFKKEKEGKKRSWQQLSPVTSHTLCAGRQLENLHLQTLLLRKHHHFKNENNLGHLSRRATKIPFLFRKSLLTSLDFVIFTERREVKWKELGQS